MGSAKYWKASNKAEFSQKELGIFKCPDKRCECYAGVILGNSYIFKNVDKIFNLKAHFTFHRTPV